MVVLISVALIGSFICMLSHYNVTLFEKIRRTGRYDLVGESVSLGVIKVLNGHSSAPSIFISLSLYLLQIKI